MSERTLLDRLRCPFNLHEQEEAERELSSLQEVAQSIEKYRDQVDAARSLIMHACDIMEPHQVGQWTGVRAWLESETEDFGLHQGLPSLIDTLSIKVPDRPEFGAPCNGCGQCCKTEACNLSRDFLGSTVAPCVALEYEDGRYWCGLVKNPAKHLGLQEWAEKFSSIELSPKFAYLLGLGMGCDADYGDTK